MIENVRSIIEDEVHLKLEALKIYSERILPLSISTKEQEMNDLHNAMYNLDKRVALDIIGSLKDNMEGLIISENNLHRLEHITLEVLKSMLAYKHWTDGHRPVDDNTNRIDSDWTISCSFLSNYLSITSPEPCTDSVKYYFKSACGPDKEKITRSKAYLLFLALGREPKLNYLHASKFVDNFYREDLIIPALDGNTTCQNQIRKLLLPDNPNEHFEIHSMANMVEANIFRIKKIVPNLF